MDIGDMSIDEEKKRKRLERNRESARECRKRKKDKQMLLRQQLAMLEADNLQLRLKLQIGPDSEHVGDDHQSSEITQRLEEMMSQCACESDIQNALRELQERYSDYGRDRRSAIAFHLSQLRRCLQPTQTTRTMVWLISCAPLYHELDGRVKNGMQGELSELWHTLLSEVNPTIEQSKALVDLALAPLTIMKPENSDQSPYQDLQSVSDDSDRMLNRLDELICTKNASLDTEMTEIQNILNPRQIAKFLLWIKQNPACIQMLEALWPHVTAS